MSPTIASFHLRTITHLTLVLIFVQTPLNGPSHVLFILVFSKVMQKTGNKNQTLYWFSSFLIYWKSQPLYRRKRSSLQASWWSDKSWKRYEFPQNKHTKPRLLHTHSCPVTHNRTDIPAKGQRGETRAGFGPWITYTLWLQRKVRGSCKCSVRKQQPQTLLRGWKWCFLLSTQGPGARGLCDILPGPS